MPAHSSLRHPKKTLLKASSFDVLRQLSFAQENGFNLSQTGLPMQDIASRRPASSGNLIAQSAKCAEHESSLAFQVGNADNDDVFTDRSTSVVESKGSSSKDTGDGVEEASTGSEEPTSQDDGNWSLVPREPLQVDAQNIYPSSACVFVANLTQAFDDRRLEIEVTKFFSQFGTVFVKIRRDSRQMPFAFCQFTCDADAENAGKHGNGAVILGRPCRVEKATAHSCFIVYKVTGEEITRQEAINLLGSLGPIAKVYPLDLNSQKMEKISPAMVVHYKRYDSSRSVTKTFEGHPLFRVDAYDPKAEVRQQHKRSDQQSYAQYEKDRRSAYFGNLPLNMTADVLKSLASQCGKVLCAEVATKQVPQAGGRTATTCFGFVEFVRPDSIDDAVTNYNHKIIDGHTLKVERKRTRTFNCGIHNSLRAPFTGMPSTWHGGRGGNASRIMNADTFTPPPPVGPSTTHRPTAADDEEGIWVSPTKTGVSHPLPRITAREHTLSISTRLATSGESSAASVRLPATPKDSSTGEVTIFRHGKEIEVANASESQRAVKGKHAMREESSTNGVVIKDEEREIKLASTIPETPEKPKLLSDRSHQDEPAEHLGHFRDMMSTDLATKDDKKPMETPTKSPAKTETKPSPALGTEPPASCFYPIIHPYPYSPYGFHPIQSLMANPMTPQGGPMLYNSFGQAYYSPTPYSDMYTMYPMVQPYPAAAMETPTRPSASSQGIEIGQSREEAYGMSPKAAEKTGGEGKGEGR